MRRAVSEWFSSELAALLRPEDAEHVSRWASQMQLSLRPARAVDLDGGNTAAKLVAVYADGMGFSGKLIMKYVPYGPHESEEPGRHDRIWNASPEAFRTAHLTEPRWPLLVPNGWVHFQEVAAHGWETYQRLSSMLDPNRDTTPLAERISAVVTGMLDEWNAGTTQRMDVTPGEFLRDQLAHRLNAGQPLTDWARQQGLLTDSLQPVDTKFGGVPNPFALVLSQDGDPIRIRTGLAHRDPHPGNILVSAKDSTEFVLVDLSRADTDSPLAHEPVYLLLHMVAQLLREVDGSRRQRDSLIALLLDPVDAPTKWVPSWIVDLVKAVSVPALNWASTRGLGQEWLDETLLSIVVVGLVMAGRSRLPHQDRLWFGTLAARAAARFAGDPPPAPAPAVPPGKVYGSAPSRPSQAVSRAQLLGAVRAAHEKGPGAVAVLHGPPGIGKTQLAVEYIESYRRLYTGVIWLPAADPDLLVERFAALAREFGVPLGADEELVRRAVFDALRDTGRWLLVLDRALSSESVRSSLPFSTWVDVLVTSRDPKWKHIGIPVEVGGFTPVEAMALLGDNDQAEAAALIETLDHVPAAVAQAARHLQAKKMTVSTYRQLVEARTARILADDTPESGAPLAATYVVAMEDLRSTEPAAADLVTFVSFFGPALIPGPLLTAGRDLLPRPLADDLGDSVRRERTIRAAEAVGLIAVDGEDIRAHRLIQSFIRDRTPAEDADVFRRAVRAAVAACHPGDPRDTETWPDYYRLWPHIVAADLADSTTDAERTLLLDAVHYLVTQGELDAALNTARIARDVWDRRLGPDHESTVAMIGRLAQVYSRRGEHDVAVALDQQVFVQVKTRHGDDDPATVTARRHVASSKAAAKAHSDEENGEVVAEWEAIVDQHRVVFGPNDLRTLYAAHNMGYVLRRHGSVMRARELDEDTYARRQDILGNRHLDTLHSAHAVGLDLRAVGEYEAALRLDRWTYDRRHEALGPAHPDTAQSAISVADGLRRTGEPEQALVLIRRAHEVLTGAFGLDNTLTLLAAHGLARELCTMGHVEEGLSLAEDTFLRRERLLGEVHLETLRSRKLMAQLLAANGEPARAAEEDQAVRELLSRRFRDLS